MEYEQQMRRAARILIVLIALAEGAAFARFTFRLAGLGNAFGGTGDGVGVASNSGESLVETLLIGVIWLFLFSPYACMMAASLNIIKSKARRGPYTYSLVMLSLITIALMGILLAEILSATKCQWTLVLMALGNVVIFGLWMYPGIKANKTETPAG